MPLGTTVGHSAIAALEERLAMPAGPGVFEEQELVGLPEPVKRYFRAAIAPGTPLAASARLRMRGRIRVGSLWLPFRARETLSPHVGLVWAARAAAVIMGADYSVGGRGATDFSLLGLVPLVQQRGPDIERSGAERAGAEGVWVPTALLPRFGVAWAAEDDTHLRAGYRVGDHPVEVRMTTTPDGHLTSVSLARWGDPDGLGVCEPHPFGMEVTGYGTGGGMTIPAAGRVGWFHGTERWSEGEFFRFRIESLRPVVTA